VTCFFGHLGDREVVDGVLESHRAADPEGEILTHNLVVDISVFVELRDVRALLDAVERADAIRPVDHGCESGIGVESPHPECVCVGDDRIR
jgi:hypothetical protein